MLPPQMPGTSCVSNQPENPRLASRHVPPRSPELSGATTSPSRTRGPITTRLCSLCSHWSAFSLVSAPLGLAHLSTGTEIPPNVSLYLSSRILRREICKPCHVPGRKATLLVFRLVAECWCVLTIVVASLVPCDPCMTLSSTTVSHHLAPPFPCRSCVCSSLAVGPFCRDTLCPPTCF